MWLPLVLLLGASVPLLTGVQSAPAAAAAGQQQPKRAARELFGKRSVLPLLPDYEDGEEMQLPADLYDLAILIPDDNEQQLVEQQPVEQQLDEQKLVEKRAPARELFGKRFAPPSSSSESGNLSEDDYFSGSVMKRAARELLGKRSASDHAHSHPGNPHVSLLQALLARRRAAEASGANTAVSEAQLAEMLQQLLAARQKKRVSELFG